MVLDFVAKGGLLGCRHENYANNYLLIDREFRLLDVGYNLKCEMVNKHIGLIVQHSRGSTKNSSTTKKSKSNRELC